MTTVNKWPALVLLVLFLLPAAVFGQSNQGEVQIYVFSDDGAPLAGVTVEVNGETHESNASGLINFTHPPGTHEFTLTYQGGTVATVEVPVREGQATEAIVTARQDGGQAEVDTGEAEDVEEIQADEERQEIDPDAPTGTLTGTVSHIESGEPVADATVIFREVDFETQTDENGAFTAELPEGVYSFSVIHPDFSSQTRSDVEVNLDEPAEVAVELTPAGIELEEVPVFATEEIRVQGGIANLLEETRNSGAVINLIGQEQIGRTGDSDAAAALKRVTGITVVDGRFVYVRGMGERYSSSYLNGSALPSPELDKRVVPLDLFPADVIESLAVQKTYTPDLGGDFGGGTVNIRTLGIPDDRYKRRLRTTVSGSVGYNTGTSLTDRLTESVGSYDWVGVDDGTRALPSEIGDTPLDPGAGGGIFTDSGGFTQEEIDEIGSSFPDTLEPEKRTIPLDYSGTVAVRDKIELGPSRNFGFASSLAYSNSWNYREREVNTYGGAGGGEAFVDTTYDSEVTAQDIDIGGLIDLAYDHNDRLSFDATSLLIRATDSVVDQYEGFFSDDSKFLRVTEQYWVEQTLFHQSVGGDVGLQTLNNADIGWRYAFSLARRYEPDHRNVAYEDDVSSDEFNEENQVLFERATLNARWFNTVQDVIHDGSLDIGIPIDWFRRDSSDFLDFGVEAMYQDREADTRRFNYNYTDESDPRLSQDPDELITDENIGDLLSFTEQTLPTDNYNGNHTVLGGYASGDILLFGDLRMDLGSRVEYSEQNVNTIDLFSGAGESTTLQTVDVLPAVNFTFPTSDNTQLRLGGSRTVNRPDLRELSPAPKYGPPGAGVIRGNPDLNRAVIYNGDVRWEAYIAERESLSVGGFYKYFEDAIEIKEDFGPDDPRTYVNVPTAFNVGGEVEWQLQLRYLSDALRRVILGLEFDSLERERRWRRALGGVSSLFRDLRTTGNVSLIYSRVDYGDTDTGAITNTERPLQGQSPYVVNASLGYKNSVSWSVDRPMYTSIFLNYNVFGPRILSLGIEGVPDVYEQPFHQLDLVFKQQFNYVLTLGFKAQNLLDLPVRETLGEDGELVQEYRKGRAFSISAEFDL